MPHRVYTPERSIVSGGHFIAYETFHLTELSLLMDAECGQVTTNEEHPGTFRLYSRMAIALGVGRRDTNGSSFTTRPAALTPCKAVPLRAIHALSRVMEHPDTYAPQRTPETKNDAAEDVDDLVWREHRADIVLAREILRLLVVQHGAHLKSPQKSPQTHDGPWDDAGPVIDLDPLPMADICTLLRKTYQAVEKKNKLTRIPAETTTQLERMVRERAEPPASGAANTRVRTRSDDRLESATKRRKTDVC